MATFGHVWIWIWWISNMDIQHGYPCYISMLDIHVYYEYPTWISFLDIYGCGYGGYPNGYPKYISIYDIHVYYGYPTWISCLDIHNIQRTELYERVDEDYQSYPDVHHFRAEALSHRDGRRHCLASPLLPDVAATPAAAAA